MYQCEIFEGCEPATREKIESELARISKGKLPLSQPRSTWTRGYGSWRTEARKDAELVRLYTQEMGFAPNNDVRQSVRDQFTHSSHKRNRQAVLLAAYVHTEQAA